MIVTVLVSIPEGYRLSIGVTLANGEDIPSGLRRLHTGVPASTGVPFKSLIIVP